MSVLMDIHIPRRRDVRNAFFFCAGLCGVLVFLLGLSFVSTGPIVLGTEMNTNGLVEYLCLGLGCETLTPMG
jgi:hypothetical protein